MNILNPLPLSRVMAIFISLIFVQGCTSTTAKSENDATFAESFPLNSELVMRNSTCLAFYYEQFGKSINAEQYANHYLIDRFYEEVFYSKELNFDYEATREEGSISATENKNNFNQADCTELSNTILTEVKGYFQTPHKNDYLTVAHENTLLNYTIFSKKSSITTPN